MSFKANSFKDACEFLVCYLVQTAYSMTPGTVRPADQVVPAGKEGDEFATVRIMTSESAYGAWSKGYKNDTAAHSTKVVETVDQLYTFVTSIQFFRHALPANDGAGLAVFGLGAFDKAARLPTRLGQEDMLELLGRMNMSVAANSPARNVAALVNSTYFEDRGSIDVTFTIPNSETLLLNTIASVTATLKLAQPGRPLDTETITAEVTT